MAGKSATPTHDPAVTSAPKEVTPSPSLMVHPLQHLQRTAGNRAVSAVLADGGEGAPLPEALRGTFEPLFARSFAGVRVHSGPRAADLVRGVGARAFTRGSDIYLGEDATRPSTIAHELAHVVQQNGRSPATEARLSTRDEPHEQEADRAATDAVQGRAVSISPGTASAVIQREEPAQDQLAKQPAAATTPVLAGLQPTIASQYPMLVLLLPEDDLVALEAASEVRYKRGTAEEQSAAAKAAKAAVNVPLALLLTPEAQFLDIDVWGSFFSMVKAGAADELTADLARNEIMRRYFERMDLDRFDSVSVELADPTGAAGGPSRLRFYVQDHLVSTSTGLISPPDLAEAFGPIEDDIESVTLDADSVALGAQLVLEIEELEPLVKTTAAGVETDPAEYALNSVRGLSERTKFDQTYVETYGKSDGPELPELEGIATRYEKLMTALEPAVKKAEQFHTENDLGESLGMMNQRWFNSLTEGGDENIEEGGLGYVVGGVQYVGAGFVCVMEGAEIVLSMGFHDAATEVATAYARGDISYNEALDIVYKAAWRALLIAAITRGAGAIGSRLGVLAATGLRITAQTTRFGAVAGGVGGVFTAASSLAAQAVLTKSKAGTFQSPTGEAIWNRGMPTGMGVLLGLGLGGSLGALGGAWSVQLANAQRIGTVVDTPTGPMRIVAITRDGAEILEPIGGRVKVPAGYQGPAVTVEPGWKPSSLVPYGQNQGVSLQPAPPQTFGGPAAGLAPFALPLGTQPLGLLPQGLQPFGTPGLQPFGTQGLQPFGTQGLESFGTPGSQPLTVPGLDLFGTQGWQPYGYLPAGPQPFGYLPAGPQPYGYLPAAAPPSDLLLAPQARLIPGTPGVVTGGSSQALGKGTMESWGLARSTSFSGWQPHHIVPSEMMTHPVIQKIGMDFDHPSNCMMLPEPATAYPGNLPTHQGFHSAVNRAVKAELDKMDVNLPVNVLEVKVFRMQMRMRAALEAGTPLYYTKGATPATWPNILNPPVPK